jgi:hypothetical protein
MHHSEQRYCTRCKQLDVARSDEGELVCMNCGLVAEEVSQNKRLHLFGLCQTVKHVQHLSPTFANFCLKVNIVSAIEFTVRITITCIKRRVDHGHHMCTFAGDRWRRQARYSARFAFLAMPSTSRSTASSFSIVAP